MATKRESNRFARAAKELEEKVKKTSEETAETAENTDVPVTEEVKIVPETPVVEETPAVEEAPVVEAAPVVEETVVAEDHQEEVLPVVETESAEAPKHEYAEAVTVQERYAARMEEFAKQPRKKERINLLLTTENLEYLNKLVKQKRAKSRNDFVNFLIEDFREREARSQKDLKKK